MKIIMACRNPKLAEVAKADLKRQFPVADLHVMSLDLNSVDSCQRFCDAFIEEHDRLDWLFCNAGVMPNSGMSFSTAARNVVLRPHYTFETGGDIIVQTPGLINQDGIGQVFMSNVFGHFILVQRLKKVLEKVIWTSSTTAYPPFFNLEDYQHVKDIHPYESSKRCIDLLSIALNNHGVKSVIASPGDLPSNLFKNAMPSWVFHGMVKPLYFGLGVVGPMVGLSGIHSRSTTAAASLLYCAQEDVDVDAKYHSEVTSFGNSWVKKLHVESGPAEELFVKVESLYKSL
jgi:17beta-estradiol 17-dehydrogenase/3beta-hydroxysteroid 3-dehydrogenase